MHEVATASAEGLCCRGLFDQTQKSCVVNLLVSEAGLVSLGESCRRLFSISLWNGIGIDGEWSHPLYICGNIIDWSSCGFVGDRLVAIR